MRIKITDLDVTDAYAKSGNKNKVVGLTGVGEIIYREDGWGWGLFQSDTEILIDDNMTNNFCFFAVKAEPIGESTSLPTFTLDQAKHIATLLTHAYFADVQSLHDVDDLDYWISLNENYDLNISIDEVDQCDLGLSSVLYYVKDSVADYNEPHEIYTNIPLDVLKADKWWEKTKPTEQLWLITELGKDDDYYKERMRHIGRIGTVKHYHTTVYTDSITEGWNSWIEFTEQESGRTTNYAHVKIVKVV